MARRPAGAAPAAGGRSGILKVVAASAVVLAAPSLLALCLVSAEQLLVPRNMPFGVAGPPPGGEGPTDATGAADVSVPIGAVP
ncbi:hypothetical protein [Streptomyces sp. DSM 15324]|uniref:hypothetical protein n=1 Tax=Streptomyces sp. DSM 15324 TaxID=1739111 RepID=UPI00074AB403|nr:hypothetical protein [Streptomyces sp. DSM 15324]KUO08769.1 hypothetical protein AQJ58_29405 [Streptomyces sp. DSM 15324]